MSGVRAWTSWHEWRVTHVALCDALGVLIAETEPTGEDWPRSSPVRWFEVDETSLDGTCAAIKAAGYVRLRPYALCEEILRAGVPAVVLVHLPNGQHVAYGPRGVQLALDTSTAAGIPLAAVCAAFGGLGAAVCERLDVVDAVTTVGGTAPAMQALIPWLRTFVGDPANPV